MYRYFSLILYYSFASILLVSWKHWIDKLLYPSVLFSTERYSRACWSISLMNSFYNLFLRKTDNVRTPAFSQFRLHCGRTVGWEHGTVGGAQSCIIVATSTGIFSQRFHEQSKSCRRNNGFYTTGGSGVGSSKWQQTCGWDLTRPDAGCSYNQIDIGQMAIVTGIVSNRIERNN